MCGHLCAESLLIRFRFRGITAISLRRIAALLLEHFEFDSRIDT